MSPWLLSYGGESDKAIVAGSMYTVFFEPSFRFVTVSTVADCTASVKFSVVQYDLLII